MWSGWSSKGAPDVVWFTRFDFKMCFALQRCACFEHLNFQNVYQNSMFCIFWLGHVLRDTTACTFSTSQLPKVFQKWFVFTHFTSKRALHHKGVQFLISHLTGSAPASGAPKHCKNRVCGHFSTFSCTFMLSSDSFSSLIFLLLFSSLTLPSPAF